MAIRRLCPDRRIPDAANVICPAITTTVISNIGNQYSTSMAGSIIIPTETKKIAPKRSFTGLMRCSMFSASMVSARMDPMTKAPSAEENPAFTASRTMPRQSPSDTTNKVSPLSHCFVFFRKVGIRNIPVIDQKTRKAISLRMLSTISIPSKCLLTANVESNTMRTTAKRSSTTRIPKTTPAKRWLRRPISSNALKMMVVDDIESIPPRKRLFMCPHPSDNPVM